MLRIKRRVFEILQPSEDSDIVSKIIDLLLIVLIFINIGIVYAYTFDLPQKVISVFGPIETISIIIFTLEYILRIWTADQLFETKTPTRSRIQYIFSWMAFIDLLSIIPFYMPMLIPYDLKVLRIVRVFRLLPIFKLSRYSSSLTSIWFVIKKKADQLISSVIIVFVLITIASLMMYNVENPAQPEVFRTAFSGVWWAIATFTTVGYGDIYPITAVGKMIASIIAILGIGLVAVPTAIISTGFIEQIQTKGQRKFNQEEYWYCPHCGKILRRHHHIHHAAHNKPHTNDLPEKLEIYDNSIDVLSEEEAKHLLKIMLKLLKKQ